MLSLRNALAKCSLMPAQRLESRAPAFASKGRIRPDMDADIVVFDADRVIDNSTYEEPTLAPTGIEYVVVGGRAVVEAGECGRRGSARGWIKGSLTPRFKLFRAALAFDTVSG